MRERIFYSRGLTANTTVGRVYDRNIWSWYATQHSFWPDLLVTGMVDVVSENFRIRQSQGEILNNPMWKFVFSLKQTKMRVSCEGRCQYYVIHEPEVVLPPAWSPSGLPWSTVVDNICFPFNSESIVAQAGAWANVDVSEIQGLASLGELPETVRMLIDLLKKAAEITVAVKRGNIFKLRKLLENFVSVDGITDAWMMYRYGIRPLMGDIRNLMNAVSKTLEKGQRFTFRGKNIIEPDKTVSTENYVYGCGTSLGVRYTRTVETSRKFRSGVLVQLDHNINQMSAIWGLDSPIEAAWELIPFSFIIDWFFNVGDCLAAAIGNPGLSPLSSWVTESITFSELNEANVVHDYGYKPTNCWTKVKPVHALDPYCSSNLIYSVKRRVPLAERFNLPRVSLNLDWMKLADLTIIARKLL